MLDTFKSKETFIKQSTFKFPNYINICQSDYPLDWYQEDFIPYAEEYQALPDRTLATIIPWMKKYMLPALNYFGESLLLVAHYYMGGEIIKFINEFNGVIGDSYQLALAAIDNPQKKIIVESAVHFMAESIAILAHSDQKVFITNPKSGCTMEMLAKDYMVQPALAALNERYGEENILPVCYMNTSGRIKALVGAQNGTVCTSSNVKKIFQWALQQNKKIFFIPDKNLGENAAHWVGIPSENISYWQSGPDAIQFKLQQQDKHILKKFDTAKLILFASYCAVHEYYKPEMVDYWKDKGFITIAHPECTKAVVQVANYAGSTAFIWDFVSHDKGNTKKYAIATEDHMIQNLKQYSALRNIEVVNIGDANINNHLSRGCGCATMSRNDPPHLVGILDLLKQGKAPDINHVQPGDVIHEFTGKRTRLDQKGQQWVRDKARISLENMIRITKTS